MERNVKRNYTEDEIKRYMELLQQAKKDPEKISKALSFENTGLFQAYLLKIGVESELIEYAAVVERARKKVGKILEHSDEYTVTENGIEYKWGAEQRFCAKDGKLYFDNSEYVTLPDEDGKVKIQSPSNISSYVAVINRFGVLEGEYTRGGPGFFGEYSEVERNLDGTLPVAHYESSDGASYSFYRKVVDFGNPEDCLDQCRTLNENYELYTGLYPRLGEWYKQYFSRYKMEFEDVSDFLVSQQEELECKEIEDLIREYQRKIIENNQNSVKLKVRLRSMIGFIRKFKEKSLVGKRVADRILKAVDEELKKDKLEKPKEEEEKEGLSRKEKAEIRLRKTKEQAEYSYKKYKKLRHAVSTIEIELEKIPLIGRQINKAAKKYEPKEGEVPEDVGQNL